MGVAIYHDVLACEQSHEFAAVAYISIIMTISIIILEMLIVIASSRGTIHHSRPRRFVTPLLYCRVIVFAVEIIALIVKTVLAAQTNQTADTDQCPDLGTAVVIACVVVAITWFIFSLVLLSVFIFLDPCHCYSTKMDFSAINRHGNTDNIDEDISHQWQLTQFVWEKRFRSIGCCIGSDESHQIAYKEVSEIIARLFYDSNLVVSDIAAGLILLQKKHFEQEISAITSPDPFQSARSISLNFHDPEERQQFFDAFHFLKFALGIYSWPIHMFMNPLCGCCNLLSHTFCRQSSHRNILGDNCCHCGFAGFLSTTAINEMDIVYIRFENDLYRVPFVVCIDHDEKAVVIAIRGTLSLHDVITDLTASSHPIELPDWPRFTVHKGMYQTVLWIKEQLDNEEVLEEAFSRVPQYKLVIVGHSLGSGCACVLALLLREQYPDLRCFCYSPTGSLLNATAAAYTQSFVTSVTLGQDLVCRLKIRTAHQFKQEVINVIKACHKPKYRIFLEGCLETIGKCCGHHILFKEDTDSRLDGIINSEDLSPLLLNESTSFTFDSIEGEEEEESSTIPRLFPPGRIIHIVDTLEERRCFFARRQLEARWSSANSFEEIVVSPDMIRDHFPDVLFRAMKMICDQKKEEL